MSERNGGEGLKVLASLSETLQPQPRMPRKI